MYPPVLLLHHKLAESLLEYRFNHLPAANAKAKSYNFCSENVDENKKNYYCYVWPVENYIWATMDTAQRQQYQGGVLYLIDTFKHNQPALSYFENLFTTNSTDSPDPVGNCHYEGAMFAWETGFTGAETCPCILGGTCLHELHITGDISFAARQYWYISHDLEWLISQGYPLVLQIAKFWASRGILHHSLASLLDKD